MDTACYYTFSTIAQTLAGAFGFLVAVVLYQMQSRMKLLEDLLKDVHPHWNRPDEKAFGKATRQSDLSAIVEQYQAATLTTNAQAQLGAYAAEREQEKNNLLNYIRAILALKRDLRASLELTGVTIGASLVLLMLTPFLWPWLAGLFLLIDVVAACWCLGTYFPLVNSLTK